MPLGMSCSQQHNAIRDVLFSAAQSAALAPRKEVPLLIPGLSSRPANVFLPIWKQGRPAALDVTVISPLQQQTIRSCNHTRICLGCEGVVSRERA